MRHARRRLTCFRIAQLLVALLSAVMLGGVQEASCAMHGMGAARATGVALADTGHADHSAQGAAAHGSGHDSQSEHHCDCTCTGDCTMVAPLATPPSVATLRVALIDPAPRRPLDLEPALPPLAEPDGLLPFANGPPASLV
jgi:hypothetical protein